MDQTQPSIEPQKENLKEVLEAVLFITGRFMAPEEILPYCHNSLEEIKNALKELKKDYEQRQTVLEIFNENDKWKLGLKRSYNYLTSNLISSTELDRPTQETLAVIAYKQPITQSEVIHIRGNKAYDHVTKLKELDFIISEKFGRTRLIKLTQKFYDYFDIPDNQLKQEFQKIESKIIESLEKEAGKIVNKPVEEIKKEIKQEDIKEHAST